MQYEAFIAGVHGFLPDYVLNNAELGRMVCTSDEWIVTRTGIRERRILKNKNQGTAFMGAEAVKGLLNDTELDPTDIDLIICATITPDYPNPAAANIIAHCVGANNAFSFDINAACSGFLFALITASQYIETGKYRNIVVVGADKMSSIMADSILEIIRRNNLSVDDVSWVIPHQSNICIINAVADLCEMPRDKVLVNIEKTGNTTAATIPLCLWAHKDKFRKGDRIILVTFGGGFTWGAAYIIW